MRFIPREKTLFAVSDGSGADRFLYVLARGVDRDAVSTIVDVAGGDKNFTVTSLATAANAQFPDAVANAQEYVARGLVEVNPTIAPNPSSSRVRSMRTGSSTPPPPTPFV